MEEKLPSWRWAIVSVVCLLCFMANYMQYQVSALAVEVMPMLNIDTVGFSMLFLDPMLTAVFFSIPLGALGDRIGSKKVVAVAPQFRLPAASSAALRSTRSRCRWCRCS